MSDALAFLVQLRDACSTAIKYEETNVFLKDELARMHTANAKLMTALTESEVRMQKLNQELADATLMIARLKADMRTLEARTRVKRRQDARRRLLPQMSRKKAL